MSVPVEVRDLAPHVSDRGAVAYLLTTGDDARPHAVAVAVTVDGDRLQCDAGNRTARNADARPLVSLLWPARTDDDFSLIVDGDASVVGTGDERRIVVVATRAVLHRPAASPSTATPGSCASDCVPLDLPAR
jgi:hypothetical protein